MLTPNLLLIDRFSISSIFLFMSAISFFSILSFFTLLFQSGSWKHCWKQCWWFCCRSTGSAPQPFFINVSHFFSFLSLSFFTLLSHQVLGSTIEDTAGGSIADQLVKHLSHFFVNLSHSFVIFISVIFIMFLPQFFWKHCW
jgi:hypothetical protein